nr:MAG TPA: hypothetical protein [Caudoviricetes sp.]
MAVAAYNINDHTPVTYGPGVFCFGVTVWRNCLLQSKNKLKNWTPGD